MKEEDAQAFLNSLVTNEYGRWEQINPPTGRPYREFVLLDSPDTGHNPAIPEDDGTSVGFDLAPLPDELDMTEHADDDF